MISCVLISYEQIILAIKYLYHRSPPLPPSAVGYLLFNIEHNVPKDVPENVPFPKDIPLPLPLDYRGKKKTSKVDVAKLLGLVEEHCEAYLKAEALPYRPDAWIDHGKIKVGYEIPFNRHFYEYEPPRPLEMIKKEIKGLEEEILAMLHEVTS